jgi:aldehyde dehydrogenase (NAD+)
MRSDRVVDGAMTSAARLQEHARAAEEYLRPVPLLLDGRWVEDTDAERLPHVNPSTGRAQGELVVAGPEEIDEAVATSRIAARAWRRMPADQRRGVMLRIAAGLRADRQRLAVLGTLSGGMTHASALAAAEKCADYFEYYAGWADKVNGAVLPVYPGRGFDYTLPEPYGVILAIINWNGPLTATARKVAAAFASGNAVVLKTPELAPFGLAVFARICQDAGVPPGVLNMVNGGPDVGAALVSHPGIDKISFTGSGRTAQAIMAAAAQQLTPVALELGGKSANLVFPDADLDAAAEMAAMFGVVRGSGQGCLLPTRLIVHSSVHDEIVDRVVAILKRIRVGDPLLDRAAEMGPVINQAACDRVLGVIAAAQSRGEGDLVVGGERLGGDLEDGYFIAPTVFTGVSNDSSLAQDEIFGPVLTVIRFEDDEQAVALANASPFALAGYVHTRDLTRAHQVTESLEAGFVSVNGFNPQPPTMPFGGHGQSGFGREGGFEGLQEFLRPKNVYISLP